MRPLSQFATLVIGWSLASPTFCLPTDSVPIEPAWKSEPNERGTMGIVLPCLITLGLCVWTAIHPNVNPQPTFLRLFMLKCAWLFNGLFLPELVLATAFQNWLSVRALQRTMMQILTGDPEYPPPSLWRRALVKMWTGELFSTQRKTGGEKKSDKKDKDVLGDKAYLCSPEVAFFINMGGYVVHPGGDNVPVLPATLTPIGFMSLYAAGLIDDSHLNPKDLKDKSKMDGLAKLIVLCQAAWMVAQCIGRKIQGLPLPILELHTIIHAVIALLMYCCWWNKPLDVGYPIILRFKDERIARDIYLLHMAQEFSLSTTLYDELHFHSEDRGTESPAANNTDPQELAAKEEHTEACARRVMELLKAPRNSLRMRRKRSDHWFPWIHYTSWHDTFELFDTRDVSGAENSDVDNSGLDSDSSGDSNMGERIFYAVHRWVKAREAQGVWASEPFFKGREQLGARCSVLPSDGFEYIVKRRRLAFDTDGNDDYGGLRMIGTWIMFPVIYGSIHAVAWSSHFPTLLESLLWRISSILIAGLPFFLLAWWAVSEVDSWIAGKIYKLTGWNATLDVTLKPISLSNLGRCLCHSIRKVGEGLVWVVVFFYALCVLAGRVYIVVESFLSLRSLPKGSYETVEWSNFWPHF